MAKKSKPVQPKHHGIANDLKREGKVIIRPDGKKDTLPSISVAKLFMRTGNIVR